MGRNYPDIEPPVFNQSYRQYVSKKNLDEKVILKNFDKKKEKEIPDHYTYKGNYYDSLVKNSHQYPRELYNVILPYKQPPVQSFFNKEFGKTPFYFGSKRYTRDNNPGLVDIWV